MNINHIKSILIAIMAFSAINASPAPIDSIKAAETARAFLLKSTTTLKGEAKRQYSPECLFANNTAYIFADKGTKAFVAVAADDRLPAIIGYGNAGNGKLPPALQAYLTNVLGKCKSMLPQVARQRQNTTQPIAPLLTMIRHQGTPYNNACPYYRYDDGTTSSERCQVGCVATALEEVITYYRRTVVLADTLHGWDTEHYSIPNVLPRTTVDTRLILDDYSTGNYTPEEVDAVARLSLYCGMAAKMNWGLNESGARVSNLEEPMKRVFGYKYVHHLDSYNYTPGDWQEMVANELRGGRPVLYAAYVMRGSGHAFVVDGMDGNGLFHVNWGYGGNYDGYFDINVLNTSEPSYDATEEGLTAGFFCNHEALFLCPDEVETAFPDSIVRTGREVVVDSIVLGEKPLAGIYTPATVYVRNTSQTSLSTPFEIFTNSPADSLIFEQADYIAYTQSRLAPEEKAKLKVHLKFSKAGKRLLRISPDDKLLAYEDTLQIEQATPSTLAFGTPKVSFPSTGRVKISLTIDNSRSQQRTGHAITYCLAEGSELPTDGDARHSRYIYLPAGAVGQDTVSYSRLTPGQTYTVAVRCPWTIVTKLTFTMPTLTSISTLTGNNKDEERWHTLDGRSIDRPKNRGMYLLTKDKQTKVVFVNP